MVLSLDFLSLPLLAAAALVFISVLAGVFSARIGFSFLLIFLVVGILAGVDGPGGLAFDDFRLSFWVGNVALAVILLDGGLRTQMGTFRTGLRPALLLATLGVVLCTAITGAAAYWLLDLPWPLALLVGAIVGSTDAAAVFSLLKSSGVQLNERVAATLEIESGMNDPMAVYLTLAFIGVALAVGAGGAASLNAVDVLRSLLEQFGYGALAGMGSGFGLAALVVGWLSSRAELSRAAVMTIVVLNALWVVESVLLLLSGWVSPTTLGIAFVLFQAAVVAVLAELQFVGQRRASQAMA